MATRAVKPRSPHVPEIRKGDTVVVLSGRDAGKRGTVERVIRRSDSPSSARSVYRRGSHAGGTSVVITGAGFAAGATVSFGATAARKSVFWSARSSFTAYIIWKI